MKYPKDLMNEVLFTRKQIVARAKELAKAIKKDYENKPLTIVCTLKGAVFFFTDLMRYIDNDCNIEFMKASSYIGNTTTSSGQVKLTKIMDFEIKNRDILIVEDIVDTGYTCQEMINFFQENGCNSVKICTLLNKPSRRKVDVDIAYVGFEISDKFVIGYGLDYNEIYRNIPLVGVINPKYIK
ncbi:MAG: hypoxanthine phosphoribosyltransferase [Erysipelotrichaceae bacterium]|nr:hypoxanthine phosphoribosyltransferase [Erysipelotrichaceae bacterium]